ncbi:YciI family protein [Microbacterium sp. F51-2R]|uniref:YciI family protein n=1 Tax=Microbacterium sp. F51-2R TaxID=3445777 RepID=UPI003FA1921A
MRWMLIMNVEPDAAARAAAELDLAEMFAVMGQYNEDMQKAGVFLAAEGLSDAAEGFRVDFTTQPPVVTDGPFAEAREVFTGYWILEVANREEAEYWARRCPLGPGTSLEVRRINDLADFASEVEEGDRLRRERQQEWQSANG